MAKGKNKKVLVAVIAETAHLAKRSYPQPRKGEIVGYMSKKAWDELPPSRQKQYGRKIGLGDDHSVSDETAPDDTSLKSRILGPFGETPAAENQEDDKNAE